MTTTHPEVAHVFDRYPEHIRPKMEYLRHLILEAAAAIPEVTRLEETLKWGEPSYLTKKGSTIRMDWKEKSPDQYAMYFKCTSKLVPTFREVFPDTFTYEGNRAIVFGLDEPVPAEALKECITAGLRYHSVKQLPLLGMGNE
jgi:hypothetical protein